MQVILWFLEAIQQKVELFSSWSSGRLTWKFARRPKESGWTKGEVGNQARRRYPASRRSMSTASSDLAVSDDTGFGSNNGNNLPGRAASKIQAFTELECTPLLKESCTGCESPFPVQTIKYPFPIIVIQRPLHPLLPPLSILTEGTKQQDTKQKMLQKSDLHTLPLRNKMLNKECVKRMLTFYCDTIKQIMISQ